MESICLNTEVSRRSRTYALPSVFERAATIVPDRVMTRFRDFMYDGYQFIDNHPDEWVLTGEQDVDLEVTNHVLRVRIQDGTINQHVTHIHDLCQFQHADGGWGNTRDDPLSRLRSTAFCAQMLLRANRQIRDQGFGTQLKHAVNYLQSKQQPDGSWQDDKWHLLDAVSVSVGTLLFVAHEDFGDEQQTKSLQRGMEFLRHERKSDGLWYYKPKASPVTITAHLLQKFATYGEGKTFIEPSMRALIRLQDNEGHWDKGNTDHTCDATRCLMLCASTIQDSDLLNVVKASADKAIGWLLDNIIDGGIPDRPGRKPHVERTCDGLDTVLKYCHFVAENKRLLQFWQ